MRDGNTRDRRPADMVVRDQKRPSNRAQDADLVPNVLQVRASSGLDLADELEASR